jgi:Zn-dependent protease with chaperone function
MPARCCTTAEYAEAAEALDRAEKQGVEPRQTLGPKTVEQIRKLAQLATPEFQQAMEAMNSKQYAVAATMFEKALAADPDNVELARWLAGATLSSPGSDRRAARRLEQLCRDFPDDGDLQTYYALALAREKRYAESARALKKSKELGARPAELVGADTVRQIEDMSRPGMVMQFLKVMGWFAAAYAVVIALMAGAGILLSAITPRVPELPPGMEFGRAEALVSGQESTLARLYMLVLILGLLLFYVSVPFVIAGLVASTGAALYLIVKLPRIPVQLLVIVVLTGLGMAWAVLKSVFASHGSGGFGIRKTPEDCPRLTAAIREVAGRTDTAPMDEIYLAPGAAIGVHQEGRGPFGMFGVKRRVLTLGLSTMSALTVSELKAILAHEYAHFSHQDTYYSRFIHQVTLSIQQALSGMAGAGGRLNYVNPFFWFFWLYYHAYSMLACGFSRSREFLADRMAVRLYGKEAFISSLTKVATEGMMFEGMMFQNVDSLLAEGKAFENIYESFRDFHAQNVSSEDRLKMYRALLEEKPSWFATHPTFQERMRAVTPFADLPPQEPQPANSLFEDPAAIEKELTDYLTQYVAFVRQMQAQAAAGGD